MNKTIVVLVEHSETKVFQFVNFKNTVDAGSFINKINGEFTPYKATLVGEYS